ncbi:NAD(P)/FAD-dependent oxidoreductase [Streptomyces roseirectus]|uniref:NAD(P)/FAD-dependent oxidoreductase n=1 Tax=Streptomyces roseirectus TaxID=2768066 RepID=A0A7H0IK85_9ACTN|nr:NAD(P)/FAD-dependent oxidoreductase [Streptomyces roseirectus]QNP73201.1 NAD(P)/FAD-dependent oxidoreductase [Streptomyces roseirectus]
MGRIVVIGAGMGAMAAAARLGIAGHRVVVYERGETYGGAVGRVEREGFGFDTGAGFLTLPAVWRDLFVKTGKEALEDRVELTQVDPSAQHLFGDGSSALLPNASRAGVVTALDEALGAGAGARWGDFLVRAREAWDRTRRPLLEEPLWPNWDVLADKEPYPAVPHKRLLRTRRASTLAEVGAWELRDARLTALLESHALAYGLDPRTAPASAAVLPYMEHAFGTWYVKGGLRELARAVYERCLARRVEFVFGADVVRVVEKDGRAAGVELADGTAVDADLVVAGTAPGLSGVPARGAGEVQPQHGLPSRLTVLLAVRGARPEGTAHRTIIHAPDREAELAALFGTAPTPPSAPTVTLLRPDDPALVPDAEHEAMVLTATVPAGGAAGYERTVEAMLAAAERAVPGLGERILWREVRTPDDVAAATGAEGGRIPPPALAAGEGRLLHPANSTALPGLFTVGGWSHPGGGLAHAGMSGALVAGLIVEGPGFRGSQ